MTLEHFMRKNPEARRIFGEKEIEIIQKQLRGITLTRSEKNRLSQNIRPKFKFIQQCALYKDEFDLKKGSGTLKELELFKPEIFSDKLAIHIKRIYIFGSFRENKMSESSDIDIAIEFAHITKKEAADFKKRIVTNKPNIIDISVFNMLPNNIQKQIKNNGKIFYSREGKN